VGGFSELDVMGGGCDEVIEDATAEDDALPRTEVELALLVNDMEDGRALL
jgi:hypothetical protein